MAALFVILTLFVTAPLYVSAYHIISLTSVFMYVVLTVSWTIFSGPTQYISLATAGFFWTRHLYDGHSRKDSILANCDWHWRANQFFACPSRRLIKSQVKGNVFYDIHLRPQRTH